MPERIDFILASSSLPVLDCRTVLQRMPSRPAINYSDHYGVQAVLAVPQHAQHEGAASALIGAIHTHTGSATVLTSFRRKKRRCGPRCLTPSSRARPA